jgi:aspartate kinase
MFRSKTLSPCRPKPLRIRTWSSIKISMTELALLLRNAFSNAESACPSSQVHASLMRPTTPTNSCTGFFGPVPGSLLRQVGRGYTDLLSALLAAALPAAELQIWKEVDGIFTADPRKVPTARLLPVISPEEAAELTYYGSEVVHPFTMEQVIRKKIPIRIKNVENPSGGGTVIHPEPDALPQVMDGDEFADAGLLAAGAMAGGDAGVTPPAGGSPLRSRRAKLPTAVTIKERILVLNIHSNRKSVSHGFLAGIFGTLDRFGIVVDLISTSEVHVSMALEGGGLGDGGLDRRVLDRLVKDLRKIGTVRWLCTCVALRR